MKMAHNSTAEWIKRNLHNKQKTLKISAIVIFCHMAEWQEDSVQPTKVIELYLCLKMKQNKPFPSVNTT